MTIAQSLQDAVMALFIPKSTIMGLTIGFVCGWWSRRSEVRELCKENRHLHEWQGAQVKEPKFGPMRTKPVFHFNPAREAGSCDPLTMPRPRDPVRAPE